MNSFIKHEFVSYIQPIVIYMHIVLRYYYVGVEILLLMHFIFIYYFCYYTFMKVNIFNKLVVFI